jgi:tRNA threonylcarbamoyladenosine biosynthesis protein TsaB
MKILALDTSSRYLCLGLFDGKKTYEYSMDVGVALSRVLTPTISRALNASCLEPADIDYYAAGLGPGSFTALRIGHAALKAIAWHSRRPVVGIPTLDILANHPRIPNGLIVQIIDAKRSLLYCSFYSKTSKGIRKLSGDQLLSFDGFMSVMKKKCSGIKEKDIIIGGDGLAVFGDKIKPIYPQAIFLEKEFWYPQPQTVIALAQRQIEAGKTTDAFRLEPIYLYPLDCQVRQQMGR